MPLEVLVHKTIQIILDVSILLMLDMPLEVFWIDNFAVFRYFVSILLMLDMPLEVQWKCGENWTAIVSILLMLDMPLEVYPEKNSPTPDYSFNPSYAGYASGRQICLIDLPSFDKFQSFLCWICLWKEWPRSLIACSKFKFQSFLCWICLWKNNHRFTFSGRNCSFNPSYAGYASGRI